MVYIICFLIGIMTAFVGSLMGVGGGIIFIPSLLFLYHYLEAFQWATPQVVVGTSLFVMIFTALSSTISYGRKGRVDYKTGTLFIIGSIPGGILGSWLNQFINDKQFSVFIGCLILVLSLFMFIFKHSNINPSQTYERGMRTFTINGTEYFYHVSVFMAIGISFVIGTLSGLFGIGGGLIMVPIMMIYFRIPAHIATATSMFMILFIGFSSSITHMFLGHIIWKYALIFVPGAWIGGTVGARINQQLNSETIEWILRIVLVMMGLRLVFEGFH